MVFLFLSNNDIFPTENKTEHVQTSKPRAEIIIQQHWYFMEWNFIILQFRNLSSIYGYWLNLNLISIHRFQVPKVFWTWNLWILNESIFSQYPMILVNFCNSQQTQLILSTAERWENFKNMLWSQNFSILSIADYNLL